jgi:hypothetical protein
MWLFQAGRRGVVTGAPIRLRTWSREFVSEISAELSPGSHRRICISGTGRGGFSDLLKTHKQPV